MAYAAAPAPPAMPLVIEQEVGPGEVRETGAMVVAAVARRKLGKALVIATCVVESCSGSAAPGEALDVVCSGALARVFVGKPREPYPRHALGSVVYEAARSRGGRRVARVETYLGAAAARSPGGGGRAAPDARAPKARRADVFAAWLCATMPAGSLDVVLDVAGGRGDLSAALLRRGASSAAVVVEPAARDDRRRGAGSH